MARMPGRWWIVGVAGLMVIGMLGLWLSGWWAPIRTKLMGGYSIDERVAQYGEGARARVRPDFERAGVAYPPAGVTLVGIKDARVLHLYASGVDGAWRLVRTYPVLGASGELGPKLRRGDRQVPEGIYAIESLNPNSRFHLSLRLNYPNDFDRARGADDGRSDLGSDIMIHGGSASVGCLAMGDPAAEELFVLSADVGLERMRVLICPTDFRERPAPAPTSPTWLADLYQALAAELASLPSAPPEVR